MHPLGKPLLASGQLCDMRSLRLVGHDHPYLSEQISHSRLFSHLFPASCFQGMRSLRIVNGISGLDKERNVRHPEPWASWSHFLISKGIIFVLHRTKNLAMRRVTPEQYSFLVRSKPNQSGTPLP